MKPQTTDTLPRYQNSARLMAVAECVMPGGVSSPVRAFQGVGGTPPVIRSGRGATVTDVDGNVYVDFLGSWGPMILGHRHPEVEAAVIRAVEGGVSFGAPTEGEIRLAEAIIQRVPGLEMVRFVNSGTEATMSAIRLSRAATGRSRVIKFDGGYHGHADSFLVAAGSGLLDLGRPSSPGVPPGAAADTLVATYNDLSSVVDLFSRYPDEIAAVIVEPVGGNAGCIPPVEGFLSGLRDVCSVQGSHLVFDEVMTGFRIARGGAVEYYGVQPDLITFGKVVGGGFPVGAYGGSETLMKMIAPAGPVYQAGTLSGNPVAVAAGLSTLAGLNEEAYGRLELLGSRIEEQLSAAIRRHRWPVIVQRVGSMFSVFFTEREVRSVDDARACDTEAFKAYFHRMLSDGYYLAPSAFECCFLSVAHTDEQVAGFIDRSKYHVASWFGSES